MRRDYPSVGHWVDSILTSFFAALIPTCVLASTTKEWWSLAICFVGTFATGVVQHRRQIPKEPWTHSEREAKREEERRDGQ